MANTFIFDDDEQPDNGNEPTENDEGSSGGGETTNNRTFTIAAIALGGLILLTLICLGVYALVIVPRQKAAQLNADATMVAIQTETDLTVKATQAAMAFTPTLAPTDTPMPTDTPTPVLVSATDTPAPVNTLDPATATVQALQTQLAGSQLTAQATSAGAGTGTGSTGTGTPGTGTGAGAGTQVAGAGTQAASAATSGTPNPSATALANTGFADEVGLPALFIMAIVLVMVILLSRRLRTAPMR